MLFIIINSFDDAEALLASLSKVDGPKVDGIELRLDRFEKLNLPLNLTRLEKLTKRLPLPLLFTVRKTGSAGLIEQLLELKPAFLDLEHDTPLPFLKKIAEKYPETKLILSYHNFEETPEIEPLLKSMQNPCAFGYKIACHAKSSLDALRLSHFVLERKEKNLTGICMGQYGMFTRLAAPLAQNLINYTTLEKKNALEGQLTLSELQEIYRYSTLSPATKLYALIGDPIDFSPSHLTHNKTFEALGKDALYVKIPVKKEELARFLELARQLPFAGMSVTMPHKETILPLLDELSEDAKRIGAVNTLLFKSGKILGINTDGLGALDALEKRGPVQGKRVIILGAGGTARAIAYEAKKRGASPILLNRTALRAEETASQIGCEGHSIEKIQEIINQGYAILVNATAVGMPPHEHLSPLDPKWILPGSLVMDAVFSQGRTPFLQDAEKKGCALIFGRELFERQAARQFELWLKV